MSNDDVAQNAVSGAGEANSLSDEPAAKKLARNAFFLLAGQMASTLISMVLYAALARGLGVVEYGNYFLLFSAGGFAFVIADWGQGAYLVREAARRPQDAGELLGVALLIRVTLFLTSSLAMMVLFHVMGYNVRLQSLVGLHMVCILALTFSDPYVSVFRSRDRMDVVAVINVTGKACTTVATIVAMVLGGGLPAALLMNVIGGLGAMLIAWLMARKIGFGARWPSRKTLNDALVGGAPLIVFFLALAVQPFVDVVVLSKLAPPEVVGWYGCARHIMGLLLLPTAILASASFPEISRLAGSIPELSRSLRAMMRLLIIITALGATGTYLFADLAVGIIYGLERFGPAVVILQVFAPFLVIFSIDTLLGNALVAIGKTKAIAIAKTVSIGVSAGLAVLLIPEFQAQFGNGGIGLVVAFGCTEVLMLTAFFLLLPRGAVDFGLLFDLLRAVVAAGCTALAFIALPSFTPWLGVPLAIAMYSVLGFAIGLIRPSDLELAIDLVRKRKQSSKSAQ